jgi:predicted ester cyclase
MNVQKTKEKLAFLKFEHFKEAKMKTLKHTTIWITCLVILFSFVYSPAQETTAQSDTSSCSPVTEEEAAQFLEQFKAIFDGPNFDLVDELFAPDFVGHLQLAPPLDREGWKDYAASFYDGISDLSIETNQVILGEDLLAWSYTFTGTHDGPLFGVPATGNPVSFNGFGYVCFNEDGMIVEGWANNDVVGLLAQIGAFPPPQEAMEPTSGAIVTEEMAAQFVERFDAIFDGPNLDIADEIFAPDFVAHLPLAPKLDREGWKNYVASFYTGMSDLTQEVNEFIVGEDRVWLRLTYMGTHDGPLFGIPATGNTVTIDGMGIVRFDENGLGVEGWGIIDVAGLLTQIGAFPPEE